MNFEKLPPCFVLPPRLYKLIADAVPVVKAEPYCANEDMYVIDADGHVHHFIYNGRLIDHPVPPDTEHEDDQ
jgi:hypothetical protein